MFAGSEEPSCMPLYREESGIARSLKRIRIAAEAIWQDGVFATQVLTWEDGRLCCRDGLIHGYNIQSEGPAYAREATLHHALQAAGHWLRSHDPATAQHIAIEGGVYRTVYHIKH